MLGCLHTLLIAELIDCVVVVFGVCLNVSVASCTLMYLHACVCLCVCFCACDCVLMCSCWIITFVLNNVISPRLCMRAFALCGCMRCCVCVLVWFVVVCACVLGRVYVIVSVMCLFRCGEFVRVLVFVLLFVCVVGCLCGGVRVCVCLLLRTCVCVFVGWCDRLCMWVR